MSDAVLLILKPPNTRKSALLLGVCLMFGSSFSSCGCGDTDFDECRVLGRILPGRGSLPPFSWAGRGGADRCQSEDTCVRFTASTLRHRHLDPSSRSSLLRSPAVPSALWSDLPGHQRYCLPPQRSPIALSTATQMDGWLAAS